MGTPSETWLLAHDNAPHVRWIRLDQIARIETITQTDGRSEVRAYAAADESYVTLGYFNTRADARAWADEAMRAAVIEPSPPPPPPFPNGDPKERRW